MSSLIANAKSPATVQRGELTGVSRGNPNATAPAAAASASPASSPNAAASPSRASLFQPLSLSAAATANQPSPPPPAQLTPVPPPVTLGTAAAQRLANGNDTDDSHHNHAIINTTATARTAVAAAPSVPHVAATTSPAFQFVYVPHSQPSLHGPTAALKVWDADDFIGANHSPVAMDFARQQQHGSRVDTSLTMNAPTSSAPSPDDAAGRQHASRTVSYALHPVVSRTRHPLFHKELPPLRTQPATVVSTAITTTNDRGSFGSRQCSTTVVTMMSALGSQREDRQQWHASPPTLRERSGTFTSSTSNCERSHGSTSNSSSPRNRDAVAAYAREGGAARPTQLRRSPPNAHLWIVPPPAGQPHVLQPPPRCETVDGTKEGVPPAHPSLPGQTQRVSTPLPQSTPFVGASTAAVGDFLAGRCGGPHAGPHTAASAAGALGHAMEGATQASPPERGSSHGENEGRQASDHYQHCHHHHQFPSAGCAESLVLSQTPISDKLSGDKGGTAPLYPAASPRRTRAAFSPNFVAAAAVVPGHGGPEMSLVSLFSPPHQQFTRAHHAAATAAAGAGAGAAGFGGARAGAAAALAARSGFRLRDLRRGTWVFAVAREECVAREGIEAEETKAALQCLPTSWAEWRRILPASSDSDDADPVEVRCLSETWGSGSDVPPPAAPSTPPYPSALPMRGTVETTTALSATSGSPLGPEPRICTSPGVLSSRTPSQVRNASSASVVAVHPALVAAVSRLTLLESLRRDEIVDEEAAAHRDGVDRPLVYERRLLTVGTLPLERLLRRWIARHRSRSRCHAHALAQLVAREVEARAALHATSETLQRRFQTMLTALLEEEGRYRTMLEVLWVQDAAWIGVVVLRLQEQLARFPLAYGGRMSRTRVCGRVEGLTRFRNLALAEEATRDAIAGDEALGRARWPVMFALQVLCCTAEPQARAALGAVEEAERADVEQVLRALETHYSLRDVVLEESVARQSWLLAGQRRGGAVGGDDGVDAARRPSHSHRLDVPPIDVEL